TVPLTRTRSGMRAAPDVQITENGKGILHCNTGSSGEYTVPDGISFICENAFADCTGVDITIPDSVTLRRIGRNAFANSKTYNNRDATKSSTSGRYFIEGLATLTGTFTIGSAIICIEDGAFSICKSMTGFAKPANGSLKYIGRGAFSGCTELKTISCTELEYVGAGAFADSGIESSTGEVYIGDCLVSVPKDVTEYSIAEGTTCIAEEAFAGCRELTEISIPGMIKEIPDGAFKECVSLGSITLNGNVTSIGKNAFRDCISLESITIPASVTEIGDYAFYHCVSLREINVADGNEQYISVDGVLFSKDGTELIHYPAQRAVTAGDDGKTRYSIGEGVFIEEYAFDHCKTVDIISIADETPKLGLRNPFQFCSAMFTLGNGEETDTLYSDAGKTIANVSGSTGGIYKVPKGVTSIGKGAFAGNENLTGIDFSQSSVYEIGEGAFKGCTGLTELSIPASLRIIGDSAFENCISLENVWFTEDNTGKNKTLEVIGDRAFCDCGLDYEKYNEDAMTAEDGVLYRKGKNQGEPEVEFGDYALHEHKGWKTVKEATCTASGEKKPDCDCGIEDTVIIPPLGHDLIHHEAKDSTCKVPGCKEYDTCSRCDYTTYEELPLDENNHTEETKIENETFSDCSQAGEYDEVVYCKDCGEELSRVKKTKEKDAHVASDPVKENEVAATCTAGGHYDSVVYCAKCKAELSRETVETKALGHSFTNYKYNNDATMEKDGTETAKCNRCDATDTRVKPGTKLPSEPEKPDEPDTPDTPDKPDNPVIPDIEIKNYKKNLKVDYKAKVMVGTTINAPEGYEIVWQDGTKGPVYTISQATQKEYKIQAKLVRLSDGKAVKSTSEETVTVNTGFFAKIIAFFRSLFNALPEYA
ncbi:MAG: leucine-rich repeat protein, partial [Clostridia bacterium]|nr:leucine-rich repeat protein [Clostridia bacterium]